ncbi:MAG: mucoidy inhibitor MuiA family protein [Pseudomonadota bacterium]
MRVPLFAAVLLVAWGAHAADLTVESKIDAVTVFPRGAEIQRVAKVEVPEGAHTVILSDLPEGTDLNSIRVEGRASGSLEIGAVDARRKDILRRDNDQSKSARRKLEDAIEEQTDLLAALNSKIESREIQKRYVENLASLPTSGGRPSSNEGRPQQDWVQLLALIGTSLGEIQDATLQLRVQVRETTRKIDDLKKELAALAPQQVRRTEVKVRVTASSELEADLIVKYQVRNARWTPFYDARLETGSRNVPSKLSLTRRASISQQTGEEWSDVNISLSTARPSGRSGAPEIYPIKVDFQPERPPAPAARPQAESAVPRAMGQLRSRRVAKAAAAPVLVQERAADIQTSGFQATFKVPDRINVSGTGDAKRVKIETLNIEPSLVVRSVPKYDTTAFLYAKMKLPKGIAPLLRGRVILFRDQTFVGRGRLPQLSSGEIHELGFGSDDAVRIKYNKIGETRGETGLISSSRTDQRKFKISIKNFHERPITYSILDQRPESLNEDIKVELVGKTKPTESNVKDRSGVLAWEGKLGPEQEKVIDFGYVVSWPSGKKVQYRR